MYVPFVRERQVLSFLTLPGIKVCRAKDLLQKWMWPGAFSASHPSLIEPYWYFYAPVHFLIACFTPPPLMNSCCYLTGFSICCTDESLNTMNPSNAFCGQLFPSFHNMSPFIEDGTDSDCLICSFQTFVT